MNEIERKYLYQSLELLKKWMPYPVSQMLLWYEEHPEQYDIEEGKMTYCLFSYPCSFERKRLPDDLEHCFLFVYDGRQIIADLSGYSGSMQTICHTQMVTDYLCDQSGWIDLEQYILEGLYGKDQTLDNPALIIAGSYVTRSYRRGHIFTTMENMIHDYVLRKAPDHVVYYSVISLDPDIACYGPDASDIPYVYSLEKDEPIRSINQKIVASLGYEVIRLEADEIGDGTKIWFAVKKEADTVINSSVSS